MSCPFIIQPHQIQGLDYPRLFPVIQWLVKIVLNFQQETAEFTKRQAALEFEKIHKFPNPLKIRDLNSLFLPKRKFKTNSNRKLNDPIRVYAALLEFGDTTASSSYQQFVNTTKENSSKDFQSNKKLGFDTYEPDLPEKNPERPKLEKKEENEDQVNLLEQQTERIEIKRSVTAMGKNIAKIVKSEDISVARNQYLDIKKEENPEILQKKLEKEREERLILTLTKEIEINTENLSKIQASCNEIKSELEKITNLFDEEKNLNEQLKESIANLEENTQESKANLQASVSSKLEALVIKRNQLKEAQKKFKEACNKEIEEINKKNDQKIDEDLQEWLIKIDKSYADILSRYEKARTILAEKNQEVAILQRKVESRPSQTELTQYQRRFVELYEQINLKVEENRRFYANYNSLIEVKSLLESEINTLDSFQQGFKQSKKKSEKESFAESVTSAIMQVAEKTKKAQEKHRVQQETLKELEKKYKGLEEVERTYYQMVKEFNELIS
jgi:CCDC93, coiled-coil domain